MLIVINGPTSSYTRKANNKRNNEEKSKKLAAAPKTVPPKPSKAVKSTPKPKMSKTEKATYELIEKFKQEEDEGSEVEVEVVE